MTVPSSQPAKSGAGKQKKVINRSINVLHDYTFKLSSRDGDRDQDQSSRDRERERKGRGKAEITIERDQNQGWAFSDCTTEALKAMVVYATRSGASIRVKLNLVNARFMEIAYKGC
ncbi:uncharacterized protein LOC110879573 isoform X2 [Helianthus annuus]|nr:uncharacterized protein LOC110879573 isoform X2 [Helianthus annuus]XP_021983738.1 uncharacterized protein LOC110879573 isoform X2 [Helianthus annuus]